MENKFNVLCLFSCLALRDEFEEGINRMKTLEIPRLKEKDFRIDCMVPGKNQENFYDLVVIDVSSNDNDGEAAKKLLNIHEFFSHSRVMVICNLNLSNFKEFSIALKDTKSFYFGTVMEGINRVVDMVYLFKQEQHLL